MKSILIVDDTRSFLDAIALSLRHKGFVVVRAENGAEAVAAADRTRPDLVLLDLAMPVMDGLTCLRTLRGRPGGKDLPVLLLSALTDRERRDEAERLGIQGVLVKSQFSLDDVYRNVVRLVGLPTEAAAAAPLPLPAAG
jgi:CheY-like chemotaxis protein